MGGLFLLHLFSSEFDHNSSGLTPLGVRIITPVIPYSLFVCTHRCVCFCVGEFICVQDTVSVCYVVRVAFSFILDKVAFNFILDKEM